MNETINRVLIFLCLIALSIAFLSFQFIQNEIENLQEQTTYLKEDLEIYKNIFNSHLKEELSQDWGGE